MAGAGSSGSSRLLGAHYSPRPVVDLVVAQALGPLLRQERWHPDGAWPMVCDPACGTGVFLESALQHLCRWATRRRAGAPRPGWLRDRLPGCLWGVDLDPAAVQTAREVVQSVAQRWDPAGGSPDLRRCIVGGDSLLDPGMDGARCDVVVGNPPFVDSEEMTRSAPELRRLLARRYRVATGNWDLYCVFIERCLELLGDDGRLGLIVPNKLLSAAYAQTTRRLLSGLDLVLLRDYARVRLFDAAVYPLVLVARRQPRPRRRRRLRLEVVGGTMEAPRVATSVETDSGRLAEMARQGWSSLFSPGRSGRSVALVPLCTLCDIRGAATVSEAYELAPLIRDGHGRGLRVANTGTVDPYRLLWGNRPLRYLGRNFLHPVVTARDLAQRLPARLDQSRRQKIVVAGLSRRLECLLDPGGLLAAKSTSLVFAVDVEPHLLVGLLNSAAASAMLRRQFGGLALANGYLRIGPPQLRELLLPDPRRFSRAVRRRLVELARELCALGAADPRRERVDRWERLESLVDARAWPLFGLDQGAD